VNGALLLGVAGIGLAACSGVEIRPISPELERQAHGPNGTATGYVVYGPMVVVEVALREVCVAKSEKGTCTAQEIRCAAGAPFVLPDLSKPFLVDVRNGFGKAGVDLTIADGWRLAGPAAPTPVELVVDGETVLFEVGRDRASTGHTEWRVHPIDSDADVLRLEIDDRVHEAAVRIGPHRVDVAYLGHTFSFGRPDPFGPGAGIEGSDGTISAPMPGTVLAVAVETGRSVEEGEVLGTMEAMKMELSLKAPLAGTVTVVGAAVGDQVALGATLFVVEPAEAEA